MQNQDYVNVHPEGFPARMLPIARTPIHMQTFEERQMYTIFDSELSHLQARIYLVRNANKNDNLDDIMLRADILLQSALCQRDFSISLELCRTVYDTRRGYLRNENERFASKILDDLLGREQPVPEMAMLPPISMHGSILPKSTRYRSKKPGKRIQYMSLLFNIQIDEDSNEEPTVQQALDACIDQIRQMEHDDIIWNYHPDLRLHKGKVAKSINI